MYLWGGDGEDSLVTEGYLYACWYGWYLDNCQLDGLYAGDPESSGSIKEVVVVGRSLCECEGCGSPDWYSRTPESFRGDGCEGVGGTAASWGTVTTGFLSYIISTYRILGSVYGYTGESVWGDFDKFLCSAAV